MNSAIELLAHVAVALLGLAWFTILPFLGMFWLFGWLS